MNSIIKGFDTKLYIQCLFIRKKIIDTLKTSFDINKLNALHYYFHDLYYQINKDTIFISKKKLPLKSIEFNKCIKKKNPFSNICKEDSGKKKKYNILLTFRYPKNIKNVRKIYVPIVLFEFDCTNKNSTQIDKHITQIEKIIKKDIYLQNYIENIILEKHT